jgi:hypothetical protein
MNRKGESFYDVYLRNEKKKGRSVIKISITKFITPEEQKNCFNVSTQSSSLQNDGSGFHQGSVGGVFCSAGFGTPH